MEEVEEKGEKRVEDLGNIDIYGIVWGRGGYEGGRRVMRGLWVGYGKRENFLDVIIKGSLVFFVRIFLFEW